MSDWQPIETAPKDGTWILVFGNPMRHHGTSISIARWVEDEYQTMEVFKTEFDAEGHIVAEHRALVGKNRGYWSAEWDGVLLATRWMPLPESPQS